MGITITLILLSVLIILTLAKRILCVINSKNNLKDDLVITVEGHREDIEFILREAINKSKWKNENNEIVCLDHGMDEETKKICKLICKDYNFVHFKKGD